jgi:hypothetical protein
MTPHSTGEITKPSLKKSLAAMTFPGVGDRVKSSCTTPRTQAANNFTGYLLSDPPAELSLIAGDAIHNLRAALDNLTWALAEKYGTPNPKKKVQFVACKTETI